MMNEATKLDPDDGKAWAELGLTQMRGGDETAARQHQEGVGEGQVQRPRLQHAQHVREGHPEPVRDRSPTAIFKVRYAKDERPVMERYVPRMLGEALASMKARYGFVPERAGAGRALRQRASVQRPHERPAEHRHPGRVLRSDVIAAISPKAEPFNWGNVLWHELGHVFAIQLSKNHVPRWFTEGLSASTRPSRAGPSGRASSTRSSIAAINGEQAARRGRHEPRVHARRRRERRHRSRTTPRARCSSGRSRNSACRRSCKRSSSGAKARRPPT